MNNQYPPKGVIQKIPEKACFLLITNFKYDVFVELLQISKMCNDYHFLFKLLFYRYMCVCLYDFYVG